MSSNAFLPTFLASRKQLSIVAALLATSLLAGAPSALAQDEGASGATGAAATADTAAVRKNLDDFVHYVLIGKPDLAQAAGEALLSAQATDMDLASVVDEAGLADRMAKAMSRSRSMTGVADIATKIEHRVEMGRKALSRDPQRISQAIDMLGKTLRERRLGEERIQAAQEYAVPQLLKALVDSNDPQAALKVVTCLRALGNDAVLPLAMSLRDLPPEAQREVASILADSGRKTALPFLLEVANNAKTTADVKAACETAFERLGGTSRDASAQFAALARKFFDLEETLVTQPTDATNNLWAFDTASGGFAGLQATPAPTAVFCDMMAMTLARRSLALDASNSNALATYVAADLRRENTLGSDAQPGRYSPQFFATASGASICNDVLAMALDARDTALVRDAIAVLAQTAGGATLTTPVGRAPIVEALSYADRRVRLDAALAIANSAPKQSFPNDFSIVPTLASAIAETGTTRAAVLGGSMDERQAIGQQLTSAGFQAVASGDGFDALEVDLVKANGVDLVVVRGAIADLKEGVARVRASRFTGASPVLVIANALEGAAVEGAFRSDDSIVVWTEGGTSESFRDAATKSILQRSGSVMDEAEQAEYAVRAVEALRGLAYSGNKTFNVLDAEGVLLNALRTSQGGMRVAVAEVLAILATPAALSNLVDAAVTSSGDEQIALCDLASAAARTSGGKADDRQLSAIRDLIKSSEGAAADAAGRLYGSLDAGSAQAVELITE
jgi:DNA-directed RNA polymerase subunit F